MSGSAADVPSQHAPSAPGFRRRRWLLLGVCGVVALLVASASLWYFTRDGGDGGSACPAREGRVPADSASAVFTFRMPECFKPAGAEVDWGYLAAPAALQHQVAVIVPVVGGNADNMIIVQARDALRDTSAESDAEIEERWRRMYEIRGKTPGPYQRRTINGARGWGSSEPLSSGGYAESWQ